MSGPLIHIGKLVACGVHDPVEGIALHLDERWGIGPSDHRTDDRRAGVLPPKGLPGKRPEPVLCSWPDIPEEVLGQVCTGPGLNVSKLMPACNSRGVFGEPRVGVSEGVSGGVLAQLLKLCQLTLGGVPGGWVGKDVPIGQERLSGEVVVV